jgi:hypothetical protein
MRTGAVAACGAMMIALALLVGGCTTRWAPGPNAQGTFEQTSARCRLLSRGLHQDPDYLPSSNRALSNTAYGLAVVGSIVQDQVNMRDCMEAMGWEPLSAEAQSAATLVAAPIAHSPPAPVPVATLTAAPASGPPTAPMTVAPAAMPLTPCGEDRPCNVESTTAKNF